jgi:nitroreductase
MENTKKIREQLLQALNWRYAVKIFDKEKIVSEDDIHTILESARLSPSSNGLEMWKFFVIKNPEIRVKLREVGYDQSKITDASHLIVITYRTDIAENIGRERLARTARIQNQNIEELDGYKDYLDNTISGVIKYGNALEWSKAQSYIALGVMIETASLLGVDSGPMEGFVSEKVDEILGLTTQNLKSVTMLALGYRGDDLSSTKPKIRREFSEVIEFI